MPTPNTAAISTKKVTRQPYRNEYMERLEEEVEVPQEATNTETPDDGANVTPQNAEEITFRDRYSNLRRYHETQMREMKTQVAELNEKINQNTRSVVLPKSPEAIQAWRQEYPEIFDIVRTVARTEAQDERVEIDKKLAKLEDERRAVARDRAYNVILQYHPDFTQLRGDEAFHLWVQAQSKEIQSWLYDNEDDAQKVVYAVNLYKAEKGIGKRRPEQNNIDASRMVAPSSGTPPQNNNKKEIKLSWVKGLTPRQYEKFEDEIMAAREQGRLVDDL